MAKVKYSKYDVYDFLDSKKAEILEKKLAPLYKIRDEIKYEGIKAKYSKINIEKLNEKISELNGMLSNIDFEYSTYSSKLYDLYVTTGNMKDKILKKGLEKAVADDVSYTVLLHELPDYNQAEDNIRQTRGEIVEEFQKLDRMVKSCKDGAQAVLQLNKLGFDTSTIKPSSGSNELLVLNINNDLLGLPEESSDVAENSEF